MKFGDNYDFELYEFQRSRTAIENNYVEQFDMPISFVNNIYELVKNVLQPARNEFGSWLYILSGYRCPKVNSHPNVKGSTTSDHLEAKAADITCRNVKELYELIINLDLPYKQLIYYRKKNMLHVSYDSIDIKKQHWVV